MVNMNEDFGAYKDSKRVRCDGRFCCLLWYYHYLVVFYTWMELIYIIFDWNCCCCSYHFQSGMEVT